MFFERVDYTKIPELSKKMKSFFVKVEQLIRHRI